MKCEYCNKEFKSVDRLSSHMCEKKRRWMHKDDPETVAGFSAFDMFYRFGMKSTPRKFEDFVGSKFYSSFVKFGSYCINAHVIEPNAYTQWLLRNGVKLNKWNSDETYLKFVRDYLKKERVERALERFVVHASKTPYFDTFWETASGYLLADWIESGKISPWVIMCSERAKVAISNMNKEQLDKVATNLDVDFWARKIRQNPLDEQWVKDILDGVSDGR